MHVETRLLLILSVHNHSSMVSTVHKVSEQAAVRVHKALGFISLTLAS